jgi:hypothetical protein
VRVGHRYYDALYGRFLTRDPSGYAGGLNLYALADNNPVNESDPSGLWPKEGLDTDPFGGSDRLPFPEPKEYDSVGEDEDPGMAEMSTPVDEMGGAAGGLPPSWAKKFLNARFWDKITNFDGKKVYQRNDLIDPNRKDCQGNTNLQRMLNRRPPIGTDDKIIIMHHMTQDDEGPMAEVSTTMHDDHRGVIHINVNEEGSRINRPAYNNWRKRYWRSRADDFRP